ncbi:MAG: formate-dependent phosphoribosylglycinamide formyltransferase [Mycobacterium sp.]|uniref:formate-dependent phosphoribosylglycinamide formyltransferase n=1 Tax=Mycobacterium sp. TaxID=1785 RepID=UPI002639EBA9|nr:formate-dependent phosphoribosylglycinamide formyltransferase [Mycobacterium sp.]MDI3313475.1 formate-dependent phosphoribosylglycinamide formyltransferase [Mycobacterium sp.]
MLLGSTELSRELVIAFQRLGAEVIAVERHPGAPAHRLADRSLVVDTTDTEELATAIGRLRPNFVVTTTVEVATEALNAAAELGFTEVVPSARAVRLTADRESLRRLAADELGLPTAPFWFAGSLDELKSVAAYAGFPLSVTPVAATAATERSVLAGPDDIEPAWQRAVAASGQGAHPRVLAETVVEIDFRVTLLTVRSYGPAGPMIEFCAPIGHREVAGGVLESWQPQELSAAAMGVAKSIAARIVKALGGRGVFGVELMVSGEEVYFCDITALPYESGLVTLRTQRLSQFELAARATLGLAVDTIMISPGAAQLIYAGDYASASPPLAGTPAPVTLADVLAVPESDVRMFGGVSGGSSWLGVALATAPDVRTARERARRVSAALHRLPRA